MKNKEILALISMILLICLVVLAVKFYENDYSAANEYFKKETDSMTIETETYEISESKLTISIDNNKKELKNDLLIKQDVIFISLDDLSNIFDMKLTYTSVITKNEFEINFLTGRKKSRITIPGDSGSLILDSAVFEKDNIIYVPLSNTLEFFKYSTNYKGSNIDVHYNDDRENMTWQEVYMNVIDSYFDLGEFHMTQEDVNFEKLMFEGDYFVMSELPPTYLFYLCDFTNDGIPELFFYKSSIGEARGYFSCYKFNEETRLVEELIFGQCHGYIPKYNFISAINAHPPYIIPLWYKWDSKEGIIEMDAIGPYAEEDVIIMEDFSYGGTTPESLINVDIKDIIYSYK